MSLVSSACYHYGKCQLCKYEKCNVLTVLYSHPLRENACKCLQYLWNLAHKYELSHINTSLNIPYMFKYTECVFIHTHSALNDLIFLFSLLSSQSLSSALYFLVFTCSYGFKVYGLVIYTYCFQIYYINRVVAWLWFKQWKGMYRQVCPQY